MISSIRPDSVSSCACRDASAAIRAVSSAPIAVFRASSPVEISVAS